MLSRSVGPGQIAASTLSAPVLFTVARAPTKMELRVEFDKADIGVVGVGQSGEFSVDAYDYRRFPAETIQVRFAPETVDGVVTYTAILMIDNSDLSLRPGMTKTVDIIVSHVANELVVPNGDLRYAPPEDASEDKTNNRSGLLGMLIPDSPEKSRTQANNRTTWVGPREVSITPRLSDAKITEVTSESFTRGDIQSRSQKRSCARLVAIRNLQLGCPISETIPAAAKMRDIQLGLRRVARRGT